MQILVLEPNGLTSLALTQILVSELEWVDELGFNNQAVMEKVQPLWSLNMS